MLSPAKGDLFIRTCRLELASRLDKKISGNPVVGNPVQKYDKTNEVVAYL